MANTEVLNTLRAVREAQTATKLALRSDELEAEERALLEKRRRFLLELDDSLLHAELRSSIEELGKTAELLAELSRETKQKLERLESVGKAIDRAASALDALVRATRILVGAGLL